MANLSFGNLAGAITHATTVMNGPSTLKKFLEMANKYGLQVANNFEANFSGLSDLTFYIQSIDMPGVKQNMTQLHYNGQVIDIPVNFDWDHSFSVTVINDAQGYLYSAVQNFVMSDSTNLLAQSGYTLTLKALTGDSGHYAGALITFTGVRITSLGSLSWGQSENNYQHFQLGCTCQKVTYTPGALGKAAGILGAVNSIIS